MPIIIRKQTTIESAEKKDNGIQQRGLLKMLWNEKFKILSLDQYEDKFLFYITKFYKELSRKDDIKWFNPNNNWALQKTYKKYLDWTFIVTDDPKEELIAFGAVQDFSTKHVKCARVMTRLYINPKYRTKSLGYDMNHKTPSNYIVKHQVSKWADVNDHLFFSVEYMHRRANIIKLANKLNNFWGHNWYINQNLFKTYNKEEKGAWQSLCLQSYSDRTIPLQSITIEEWRQKYE
jgi:hypothetical protein